MSPSICGIGSETLDRIQHLRKLAQRQQVIIWDGGLGTELERRGFDVTDSLWSARVLLENPDAVRDIHLDYYRSGADVAVTSSYQVSISGFEKAGYSADDYLEALARSVDVANEARRIFLAERKDESARLKPLVVASLGCHGASLADGSEYTGLYAIGEDELVDWHRARLQKLANCGVDLYAFETIPCYAEFCAALRLIAEFKNMFFTVSVVCRDEKCLSSGEAVEQCWNALKAADVSNVFAAGINCTNPEFVEGILSKMECPEGVLKLVYPNTGEEWLAHSRQWANSENNPHSTNVDDVFCTAARRWVEKGANIVGGCCRTTPDTIRRLRKQLRP